MRWPVKVPKDLKKWHVWFAWRPVRNDKEWIWLEACYRRGSVESYFDYDGDGYYWKWEYE